VPWNGPFEPFARATAVVIRATWDYHQALDEYRAWLDRLDATRAFNAPDLVRWNLDKGYLTELAARGAPSPASALVGADAAMVAGALERMSLTEAVIKPTVGASGVGVERVSRGQETAAIARFRAVTSSPRVLVQEFLPEVAAGEIAGVFFGGRFVLMEVELNEPGLGLHLAPGAGDRFAAALVTRLRAA
jgi:O-ureido-D-serine cyclo-ligase